MVHRREIDGVEVILGNQGDLYQNAMTWFDHDTGSVWSQIEGAAILGPLAGEELDLLPSQLTTWGAWLDAHADTLALEADTPRSGFDLEQMSIAVELDSNGVEFPIPRVRAEGVVNEVVGTVPVAVVIDPRQPTRWNVWSRQLREQSGTIVDAQLEIDGDTLLDAASGTRFDITTGRGISGPLSDQDLAPLSGFTIFPDDFKVFFPDGRTWPNAR